jgi:hypothetical protein
VDTAPELQDPELAVASDELAHGQVNRLALGSQTSELQRFAHQTIVDLDVGPHTHDATHNHSHYYTLSGERRGDANKPRNPCACLSTRSRDYASAVMRIRIPVEEAFARYEKGEVTIIDQLSTGQDLRATRKIAGAIRIPGDELPDRLDELPRDRGVISYCT